MSDRFYYEELHETGSVSQVFNSRPVRYALIFSVVVLGGAFLITPQLTNPESSVNKIALNASGYGVDTMTTGSINNGTKSEFILRRSVLGRNATDVCIIRNDGTVAGNC